MNPRYNNSWYYKNNNFATFSDIHYCYVRLDMENMNYKEQYDKMQHVPCSERVHCIIVML